MSNYRPIPPATKRSRMSKDTKLAAAVWFGLTTLERDLFDDVELMTPDQFLSLFEFHHQLELEIAGADHFTNIVPWEKPRHREHTAKRASVLAKTRHQRKKEIAHRERMDRAIGLAIMDAVPKIYSKRQIVSRPFPKGQRFMRRKK